MTPTTSETYEDARSAATKLRERIQVAGLFAGDAMAILKDLWGCYRDEAASTARLTALVEFRECPECGCDLEAEAERIVMGRVR